MTPFQEQSLVRQLNALRGTPLPAGFEQRLFERLTEEAQSPQMTASSGSKRARGKLILLAAIFVPFAAAASELAWRAVQSSRAEAEFAKEELTVIKDSYAPQSSAMLHTDIAKALASKVESAPATGTARSSEKANHRASSQVFDTSTAKSRTSPERSNVPVAPPSERNAKIEKLAPNWNSLGNTTNDANLGLQPNSSTLRMTPSGIAGVATDNPAAERRSEIRAGERRGNGSGEQRAQQRERLRLGQ